MRSWTAEGLDNGNMMIQFLDEVDQLVSKWKASTPTCQQSSSLPLETSRQQEGPSGGKLDVNQCTCGSFVSNVKCSTQSQACRDTGSVSRSDVISVTVDFRYRLSQILNLRCVKRQLPLAPLQVSRYFPTIMRLVLH